MSMYASTLDGFGFLLIAVLLFAPLFYFGAYVIIQLLRARSENDLEQPLAEEKTIWPLPGEKPPEPQPRTGLDDDQVA